MYFIFQNSKKINLVFGGLLLFSQIATADEGMWLYNNLPTKVLKEKYNFEVTEQWKTHLMHSSVRFNSGGSGSFISSSGLVLTNHHVASDTLNKISSAEHNYLRDGFYAKTTAEEIKAPDLELNQLDSIENVTDRVNAAVPEGATDEQAAAARRLVISKIESESLASTGMRSDVVPLYQGGEYHLYRYKKYTDVRLVFAPEFSIAFFGGDPDNFEFPRYDLDMAIFRVYENNKPAEIKNFLTWGGEEGVSEEELVFVSGHPGKTSRLFTVAALEFSRDENLPLRLNQLRRKELVLHLYSQRGIEQARQAEGYLFGVQNSRKALLAQLAGLQNPSVLAEKQKAEYELLSQAQANPELQKYAAAWSRISDSLKTQKRLLLKASLLDKGTAFDSNLFKIARTLVRLAEENKKPNGERLPEFQDAGRATLELQLFSDAPIYKEFDEYTLADSLAYFQEQLGPQNQLVKAVLMGKSPTERAHELVQNTTLHDVKVRRMLAKGGASAINESYDPMIAVAKIVDKAARDVRKKMEDLVQEPQKQAYAQIAKVKFALLGTSVYPDATFTLRLAFGTVSGYKQTGESIPAWTTLGGAFEHEIAHEARDPYVLPPSWHRSRESLNLDTPYNFVSTADIIGGNSGSPVVNKDGKLVGLIFDGNIQSLSADYIYTDTQSRAVSVDVRAMNEALIKIYGANSLVEELKKP